MPSEEHSRQSPAPGAGSTSIPSDSLKSPPISAFELAVHEALRPIKGVLPPRHLTSIPYFFPEEEFQPIEADIKAKRLFLTADVRLRQTISPEYLGAVSWFLLRNPEYWLPVWEPISNLERQNGPIPEVKRLHDSIADRVVLETRGEASWIESHRLFHIFRPEAVYDGLLNTIQKKLLTSTEEDRPILVSHGLKLLNGAVMTMLDWEDSSKTIGWLQRSFSFVQSCTGPQREQALRWMSAVLQSNSEPLGFYIIDQMTQPSTPPEIREILLSALERSTTYHGTALLLRLGLTKGIDDISATRALAAARRNLPEFCHALGDYLDYSLTAPNSTERSARLAFISSAGGYAGEFWGDYCLTAFERPLRLLKESGHSASEAHQAFAPALSRSIFLFAYGLADGNSSIVSEINGKFQRVISKVYSPELGVESQDQRKGLESRCDIVLKKLKLAFVQSAFVPSPAGVESLAYFDKSFGDDRIKDDEIWEKINLPLMRELERFSNFVEALGSEVRWDSQELLSCRLAVRSARNPRGIPVSELEKRFGFDPSTNELLVVSLTLDPLRPGPDAERIRQADVLHWEAAEYGANPMSIPQLLQTGLTMESIQMLADNNILTAVRVFLRAHTAKGNFELVQTLADAINHMDPPFFDNWRNWRYNPQNDRCFQQLARLWVSGQVPSWVENQILVFSQISNPALDGDPFKGDYCWYFTDDPLLLFSLGTMPAGQRSCSAYDGGTYYSKSLVSYVCDAHIKAGILISLDSLRILEPQLYEKFRDRSVRPHDLALYRSSIVRCAVSRTVIKLTEDGKSSSSSLLCEPEFVVGSSSKYNPTFIAELADYCVGKRIGAPVYLDPNLPGDKSWIVVPQSRNPGGQVENWDGMIWLATQKGRYALKATRSAPCPSEGPPGISWHYIDRVDFTASSRR